LQLLVDLYELFVQKLQSFSTISFRYLNESYLNFIYKLNRFSTIFNNNHIFELISQVMFHYEKFFEKEVYQTTSLEFILFNELIEQIQRHFLIFTEWNRNLVDLAARKSDFQINKDSILHNPVLGQKMLWSILPKPTLLHVPL
jgi:hypothetical protein